MNERIFNALDDPAVLGLSCVQALFGPIASQPTEVAGFAYLDRANLLLGKRTVGSGRRDTIVVPVREITADVLAFDAAAVIMAHNHPGGDPRPSAADRILTKRLALCLDTIGTRLVDHVIVTATEAVSLRALGLL